MLRQCRIFCLWEGVHYDLHLDFSPVNFLISNISITISNICSFYYYITLSVPFILNSKFQLNTKVIPYFLVYYSFIWYNIFHLLSNFEHRYVYGLSWFYYHRTCNSLLNPCYVLIGIVACEKVYFLKYQFLNFHFKL